MNALEERIRAATRAAGDTVPPDGVPPLRLPPGHSRVSRPPRLWSRRLAPVAAAAAVIVVAVAAVAVSRALQRGPAGPESPPAGPPISWYVGSGQVPAYYVAITHQGDSWDAVVRSTETGEATETIQPSAPDKTIVAVTAAADGRTFVLDEEPTHSTGFGENPPFSGHAFYMFRLSSSGRPGPLKRLPVSVPPGQARTALALSPDGTMLAVAVQPTSNMSVTLGSATELSVYTLATGAKRTWSAVGSVFDGPKSLSWTADQRSLAFVWIPAGPGPGVRLLDLGSRGTDLLAGSRQVAPLADQPSPSPRVLSCNRDWIITPDGSAAVCAANRDVNVKDRYDSEVAFFESSTVTGKLTRILGHWEFGNVPYAGTADVLWSNASGSVLIGVIPGTDADSGCRVGVISGNRFTPLPAAPGAVSPDFETW